MRDLAAPAGVATSFAGGLLTAAFLAPPHRVESPRGQIEAIPMPAGTVDVVISNCVVNLSTDKPAVFAETFRVLDESVRAADAVITMGCGDASPIYPGKRYEDWELDDPAGQPVEVVRHIRDEIDTRVRQLLTELGA
jgi:arsenate reductase (thioredoxin)